MIYLPDTNAFSAYLAGRSKVLIARMNEAFANDELRLSVMVSSELEFGAEKARRQFGETKFARRLNELKKQLPIEPMGDEFPGFYAQIRATLESLGHGIGDRDAIIAAHALSLDATMVTANLDEFKRVPGLKVENWLAEIVNP